MIDEKKFHDDARKRGLKVQRILFNSKPDLKEGVGMSATTGYDAGVGCAVLVAIMESMLIQMPEYMETAIKVYGQHIELKK